MAIGWLSVLKLVPWGEVIGNAPRIAESAKRLWGAVARSPAAGEPPRAKVESSTLSGSPDIAKLHSQFAAALTEITDLHTQMLATSELIKALAEQNTELVKRVEMNRIRLLWLGGTMVALVFMSVIGLVIVLSR